MLFEYNSVGEIDTDDSTGSRLRMVSDALSVVESVPSSAVAVQDIVSPGDR